MTVSMDAVFASSCDLDKLQRLTLLSNIFSISNSSSFGSKDATQLISNSSNYEDPQLDLNGVPISASKTANSGVNNTTWFEDDISLLRRQHLPTVGVDDYVAISLLLNFTGSMKRLVARVGKQQLALFFSGEQVAVPLSARHIDTSLDANMNCFYIDSCFDFGVQSSCFSVELFRRLVILMKRKGLLLDTFLNTHPLQASDPSSVLYVPSWSSYSREPDAEFTLRYSSKGGGASKNQRKMRAATKPDLCKRPGDATLGLGPAVSKKSKVSGDVCLPNLNSDKGLWPYSPKPFTVIRRPFKFLKGLILKFYYASFFHVLTRACVLFPRALYTYSEQDMITEPWGAEEDKLIVSMIKEHGEKCFWLVEQVVHGGCSKNISCLHNAYT